MKWNSKLSMALLALLIVTLPVCAVQEADDVDKPATAKPGGAGSSEVLAYLDGAPVTRAEVEDEVRSQMLRLRQEEYDLHKRALDQYVLRKLVDKELADRGITIAELMKIEVEDKIGEPAEAELREMYEANKDHESLKGRTYEEVKPFFVQQAKRQLIAERQSEYMQELMAKADLRVMMEPPRAEVPLPEGEPSIGPPNAPVTIVEFADFQCGYCKRSQPTVERILAEYGDKVHFVYRDYALEFHPRAVPAAIAARCAGDQGKYWEYHGHLMSVNGDLEDPDLKKRAEDVGLDLAAFNACYESKRHDAAVQAGFQDGGKIGVTGTPTFFINGRMLVGAQPYEQLKSVIEEELRRAGEQQKGG